MHEQKPEATHENNDTVSMLGDAGRKVAENVQRLAMRDVTIDELGPAYRYGRDGFIDVSVDEESARVIFGK